MNPIRIDRPSSPFPETLFPEPVSEEASLIFQTEDVLEGRAVRLERPERVGNNFPTLLGLSATASRRMRRVSMIGWPFPLNSTDVTGFLRLFSVGTFLAF